MKKSYIIIILFLGIFFIPNNSFACGSEKHSCEKEVITTKAKEKSCCDSNKGSDDKGCNGKCGHSNCTKTASVVFSLFVYNEIEFTNNNFDFATNKSKFYHSKNLLSDGFSSIWLIPKIG
jgi:hypothetical protein